VRVDVGVAPARGRSGPGRRGRRPPSCR